MYATRDANESTHRSIVFDEPPPGTSPSPLPSVGPIGYTLGGVNIYGPMDIDMPALGQGCTNQAGACDVGMDWRVCRGLLENTCGTTFLRPQSGIDDCGGRAGPNSTYHYNSDLACEYNVAGAPPTGGRSGHAPLIGFALDGRGIYGQHETVSSVFMGPVTFPVLDACGGHTGPTPASTYLDTSGATITINAQANAYHYHVVSGGPSVIGCFGPVASVSQALALYPQTCGNGLKTYCTSSGVISYDLDCPVFGRNPGGAGGPSAPGAYNMNYNATMECPACKGDCLGVVNYVPPPTPPSAPPVCVNMTLNASAVCNFRISLTATFPSRCTPACAAVYLPLYDMCYAPFPTTTVGISIFSSMCFSIYVPGAVSGIAVTSTTASSVSLTWMTPAANGAPITGFVVSVSRAVVNVTNANLNYAPAYTGVVAQATLSDLVNGVAYVMMVQAINSLGLSRPSYFPVTTSVATYLGQCTCPLPGFVFMPPAVPLLTPAPQLPPPDTASATGMGVNSSMVPPPPAPAPAPPAVIIPPPSWNNMTPSLYLLFKVRPGAAARLQFTLSPNLLALSFGNMPGCTTITLLNNNTAELNAPLCGVCTDVWTFGPTPVGPHNVTETCTAAACMGVYNFSVSFPSWSMAANSTVNNFASVQTDGNGLGQVFTYTRGCIAPTTKAFEGTWLTASGACVTMGSTAVPNQLLIHAVRLSLNITNPPHPMWPAADLQAQIAAAQVRVDASPAPGPCTLTFNNTVPSQFPYTLTCGNVSVGGAAFFGLQVNTPTGDNSGGYGSSFYTQQYVVSRNTFNQTQLLYALADKYYTSPVSPFVFNVTTAPNMFAYALEYFWAPNCNPCPVGQYQFVMPNATGNFGCASPFGPIKCPANVPFMMNLTLPDGSLSAQCAAQCPAGQFPIAAPFDMRCQPGPPPITTSLVFGGAAVGSVVRYTLGLSAAAQKAENAPGCALITIVNSTTTQYFQASCGTCACV
jgi:hypothetical protein